MYIKRNISLRLVLRYAWLIVAYALTWNLIVFSAYYFLKWTFIDIPFQPISVIGIAVAFFIGFKNNQSYDRFWEGRKIWGAIVNYSRTWGNQVLHVISAETKQTMTADQLTEERRVLVYRHIAWLHALRLQLRQPSSFSLKDNALVEHMMTRHRGNERICEVIAPYLSEQENEDVRGRRNIATQLVKLQGRHLQQLKEKHQLMDGFDFTMMMRCLEEFYNFQGRCERIKNTPFPRQYAYFSKLFTYIFVLLLPFGLLNVFDEQFLDSQGLNSIYIFSIVPLSVLISWIFLTWEVIGDNSEDPFENKPNDVPMTSLTRTIEIDLRDMLDEEELPEKAQPVENILY